MRIVIVEDDAVVASTLSLYLQRAGYETAVARDGVRGLELASGKGVALLILDLMIPGISGQEICKRLRRELDIADHDAHCANFRSRPGRWI